MFNGKEYEKVELLLDLETFGADDVSRAFLKVGDILEIAKGPKETEIALEPEIICCYKLSEKEIEAFLNHVHRVKSDGSSAATAELLRCHAFWEYILQHPWEDYSNATKKNFAHNVLLIIDKLCSSTQRGMLPTVQGIVQEFSKSAFFKLVLPEIVENLAKENCISGSFKVVQNVLEHVLNVSPSSGRRVLPMAKVLAESLVNSSCGKSAVDFLEKLSLMVAIAVPGVHADLEAFSWRDLPLLLLSEEIHKDSTKTRTTDLPVIKKEGKEECFHKLKNGVSHFLSKGKCDSKKAMMYRITLKGLCTHKRENSPTTMSIGLQFTVNSEERIDWGSASWLVYGNLLCISCDGSFEQPVWAVVEKVDHEQRVIWVALCGDKTNNISEAEFVIKLQGITDDGKEAHMAESQTFYLSFGPAMDILQHKDSVPFKDFLVHPEANHMCQAEYVRKIEAPPDWGIIFESPPKSHDQDESSVYSLVEDFERMKLSNIKAKLDDTQLDAIDLALKNKVALIQGPPGTGKSFVGVSLVHLLLSMDVPKTFGPIFVVTYKNDAVDHFLEGCLDLSSKPRIVRVGKSSRSEKLEDCLLFNSKFVWSEVLKTQKEKLRSQLRNMQHLVKEAYSKLQGSCVFNADMFIQTATEKQVRELLIESNDQAKVDKLLKERSMDGSYKSHLKGCVRNALGKWLPGQVEFDRFARENGFQERVASHLRSYLFSENIDLHSATCRTKKRKLDQEQENPDDFREPSVEEDERISSALEYEFPDDTQDISDTSTHDTFGERKLIPMDERKVDHFIRCSDETNIWVLNQHARIQLVYALQSLYAEKARMEFLDVSREAQEKHHQYTALRNKHEIDVMRQCEIIGMTVTGAAMRANLLEEIKPSVMIVEEAAEILEGQLVAAIPPSVQHLIMIGDHQQLKPVVQNPRLRKTNNLDVSMFERLVNCKIPFKQLEYQCRMRDDIVDLLRTLKSIRSLKQRRS
ncbi:unnamed protein product [Pocillopora meandrina]|uniref:DNA2/NAM7 helicase helicase domain-containing protein n=1 Tax=Pocillopora meandrina TaxID=46732 RepID=A0AAU9WYC0_9CNID|nr:unnamed protein product [Pocillopora meandrina]